MRTLTALVATALLASTLGCGMLRTGSAKNTAGTSAKKDCAACEKMCAVAGDAEKNPAGIEACKADCKKTCTSE